MPLGPNNPTSFRVGGGPTRAQVAYNALRSAVGTGNSADVSGTMIEAWRRARAKGLAAVHGELRAVFQGISPDLATDMIPMYERILRRKFPADTPDQVRRRELLKDWTSKEDATTVEAALQEIEPTVTVEVTDHDEERESQPGRVFEDYDPSSVQASGPPFNGVGVSGPKVDSFPNFSDSYRFYVRFPHASGSFPESSRRTLEQLKKKLAEIIPAWADWVIFADDTGFTLDLSLLDVTAL